MTGSKGDSLAQLECDLLEEHSGARVVIRRATRKAFNALDERAKGRFSAVMKRWCDNPAQLTPEMFNPSEGRSSRHNVMLQAFKNNSAKARLYGFSTSLDTKRTFIILDADLAKKQTKADQDVLKRARKRIDDFLDKYGSKDN